MTASKSERLARLEEKHKALTDRVTNQDAEFKRRLGELNNEHARTAAVVDHTQSQEQARADVDKVFAKIDANDKAVDLRLKALEGSRDVAKGRAVIPNALMAAAAGGLGLWVVQRLLNKGG